MEELHPRSGGGQSSEDVWQQGAPSEWEPVHDVRAKASIAPYTPREPDTGAAEPYVAQRPTCYWASGGYTAAEWKVWLDATDEERQPMETQAASE